jgi:uncharacterized protein YndB with AHSA1/START domain
MGTKENEVKQEKIEIKKTMAIDSSSSVIFRAITEANELTKWFPDHVIFEPKIGGKVRFSFHKEKNKMERLHCRRFDHRVHSEQENILYVAA